MTTRPVIFEFHSISEYVAAMLAYRKQHSRGFSILKATKNIHRCSPALVSLITKGQRKLTLDRVDGFARLLDLTAQEKNYLFHWVKSNEPGQQPSLLDQSQRTVTKRGKTNNNILKDWLHVYVKDSFRLKEVQEDIQHIYKHLGGVASRSRIDRSIQFLLKEGYLRKTLQGEIVENENLSQTTDDISDKKIRAFHKNSLNIAAKAIQLHPVEQRYANAFVLTLNDKHFEELKNIIQNFSERVKDYIDEHAQDNERLYQLIVHLSPTGGRSDKNPDRN